MLQRRLKRNGSDRRPKDELEAMIAAQLIVAHTATIECFHRAAKKEEYLGDRRENLDHANRLSRSFTGLLEALGRYRGKSHRSENELPFSTSAYTPAGKLWLAWWTRGGAGRQTNWENNPMQGQMAPIHLSPNSGAKTRTGIPVQGTLDAERTVPNARRPINRSPTG